MHSILFQDTGAWTPVLLDAALKSLALLGLAAITALFLRKASAASRHLNWGLAVAGVFLMPILSALLPAWNVPIPSSWPKSPLPTVPAVRTSELGTVPIPRNPIPAPMSERQLAPIAPASPALEAAPVQTPRPPTNVPLAAWLSCASVILVLPLFGAWQILRLRHRSVVVADPAWCRLLDELRATLHIHRRVVLLMSDRMAMPITWGAFRPVLLLPAEAADWPEERRRVVLLHELAHIKRWDWLTQMLAQVACALHWFNPLIWYAARRMKLEREQACDDLVLASGSKPSEYASELLQFANRLQSGPLTALAAVPMARPSSLEGRLLAILDGKRRRNTLTLTVLGVGFALLAAAVVPVAMLRAADAPAPEKRGQPQPAKPPTAQPRYEESRAVLAHWGSEYAGSPVVPPDAFKRLAEQMNEFLKQYPDADEAAARLASILPKVVAAAKGPRVTPKMEPVYVDKTGRISTTQPPPTIAELEQKLEAMKSAAPEFPAAGFGESQGVIVSRGVVTIRGTVVGVPFLQWTWEQAAKLLDEICDASPVPVGWLAHQEQVLAFERKKDRAVKELSRDEAPADVRALLEKHRLRPTSALPDAGGQKIQSITVDKEGRITLNAIPVTIGDLENRLKPLKEATPELSVVIASDRQTQYAVIMEVLNTLGRVGITQVGLKGEAEPQEEGIRLSVRDAATGERLKSFRVVAGVPSSVSMDFERTKGAPVAAWQGHTIRAGADGWMFWPTARAYDEMMLRVEADGYIPGHTAWLKKGNRPADIGLTLNRDAGIQGRAILPNGKPAAEAIIALATAMRDAVLENGKLRHFDGPPGASMRDQWQRPVFIVADQAGAFRLPTEIDPTAAVLITHEGGVREMSFEQIRKQPEVSLLGWGRVEGRVQWGTRTGENEVVHLTTVRDGYGYPGIISQYEKTKADAQGRFVFEKVLPGTTQISSPILFDPPAEGVTSVNLTGRLAHYEIRAGSPSAVVLGGVGRTVRGRLTGRASWDGVTIHFHPRAPHFGRSGDEIQWKAWNEFQKGPGGPAFFRSGLKPNAEGMIEIPNVLPASYQLFISADKDQVGHRQFDVKPETPGTENEVVDLGEISVKP
jgi:beta-lactamase regulating signal transducer with metallopeptidase domain/biopolymer transport protein ExbD